MGEDMGGSMWVHAASPVRQRGVLETGWVSMSQIIYGEGVLTVEGVVAHRASLLCVIKPLREPLKPVVDASWMVVGARR